MYSMLSSASCTLFCMNPFQDVTVLSVCGDNGVADFVCDSRKR